MCNVLHVFLIWSFNAHLAYTFGVNTQEVIEVKRLVQLHESTVYKLPLLSVHLKGPVS